MDLTEKEKLEIEGLEKECEKAHIQGILIEMDEGNINSANFMPIRMSEEQAKTVMRILAND